MHSPAWSSSIEARKAAADAAVALQQSGQSIADIARSMDIAPVDLEAWIKEHHRPERIRGAYIAPDENTVADHEARLDLAAQDAQERYGLGWYQSELRASLPDSDREFLEQTDQMDWSEMSISERARYGEIQKSMSVSQEFVMRLFEFLTHGHKVTKYRERMVRVKRIDGYSIESILIGDVLPSGSCRWPKNKLRRNRIVVIRDHTRKVCRTFLRAQIAQTKPDHWRIKYDEPHEVLNKAEAGDRLLHLYFMAKLDREQCLTQQQLGRLGGKTKAASSAMMRNMDKRLREMSQSKTGFLAKPPKPD